VREDPDDEEVVTVQETRSSAEPSARGESPLWQAPTRSEPIPGPQNPIPLLPNPVPGGPAKYRTATGPASNVAAIMAEISAFLIARIPLSGALSPIDPGIRHLMPQIGGPVMQMIVEFSEIWPG